MMLGFSCGDFYRLQTGRHERFSQGSIQRFVETGARAIELMCHAVDHLEYLISNEHAHIRQFEHVSIHAPAIGYDDDFTTHELLQKMQRVCADLSVAYVVFHPDAVKRWDVIGQYDIPVAIENMDDRKKSCKNFDDMKTLLDRHPFGLVIDLQHCFVNDPTMQLARDLHAYFFERVVGYHISGYDPTLLHVPLHKTDQKCIIDALEKKHVPIIIESSFAAYGEEKDEYCYIKERIF